jgi:membrane-associated protein
MHFDLKEFLTTVGYVGIFAIVFAESGLFFGFFLPGDSLLVTAGLLATQKIFSIWVLLPLLAFAAISGDSVGYWFGKKFGRRFFQKEKSLLFSKKHLDRAHAFYEKYGGKTIIIGRFIPVVRTFAPIVAGIADMDYKKFISFNAIGGLTWSCGMLLIGYTLGSVIPNVDRYMFPIIAIIIFFSLLPPMIEAYKHNQGKIFAKFMSVVKRLP